MNINMSIDSAELQKILKDARKTIEKGTQVQFCVFLVFLSTKVASFCPYALPWSGFCFDPFIHFLLCCVFYLSCLTDFRETINIWLTAKIYLNHHFLYGLLLSSVKRFLIANWLISKGLQLWFFQDQIESVKTALIENGQKAQIMRAFSKNVKDMLMVGSLFIVLVLRVMKTVSLFDYIDV